MNILILLILYIQEHGISYLFKSFSIYFIFVLQFSEYKTLLLWLYLFLSILFFDAIVNVIVFHISLSGSSVLMFRNVTDFWISILYSENVLNYFIIYYYFWLSLYSFLYLPSFSFFYLENHVGCLSVFNQNSSGRGRWWQSKWEPNPYTHVPNLDT